MTLDVTKGVTEGVTVRSSVTPGKIKKALPVEQLLWWAYGVELVRGLPTQPLCDDAPSVSSGRLWASECNDDALTLDLLVSQLMPDTSALVRRACHRRYAARLEAGRAPSDGAAAMGLRGRGALCGSLHYPPRDLRLSGSCRICATCCSRCGRSASGRCAIVRCSTSTRPRDIARMRYFYIQWYAGLEVLRNALKARAILSAYEVSDGLPPPHPWRTNFPVDEATTIK